MATKLYYVWDDTTKYYLGSYEAQENPNRPGTWIHPITSTDEAPNPDVDPPDGSVWRRDTDDDVWELYMPPEDPVPELSDAGKVAALKQAVRAYADSVAATQGFTTLMELIVLADEDEVPTFQTKALVARAWWANVWNYTLTQTALMLSHSRTFPEEGDWIDELPEISF